MSKIPFNNFGPMYDCSRNAVLSIPAVKKLIDICKDLGYTSFALYTEDTYEVKDNPYFGYGRGRYSMAELKEIDQYAAQNGLTFIPCIQTLGHLTTINRWPEYHLIMDCEDILLVDEEKVYTLIDNMFASLASCISGKVVNVGMDEAHMLGRGKYYDIHGENDKTEILVRHIARVAEIAKKYDFTICMWSDMFFRLATKGDYYASNVEIDEAVKKLIPENVTLVYWDYYSADIDHYNAMFKAHEKIKNGTYFAGVLGSCRGFTPCNGSSIKNTKPAIESCIENGIKDVMLTAWGDDGGECPRFSFLPSLFYAAEIAKGNSDMDNIKKAFEEKFELPWDAFMLLDLINGERRANPSKKLLYNDLLFGLVDTQIKEDIPQRFADVADKLSPYRNHETWGYLFDCAYTLCRVIEIKALLGIKIRKAYQAGDKDGLLALIPQCKELIVRLTAFYESFKKQWYTENKGFGFEVQDIRLGGLIKRAEHCTELLVDYTNGKISKIDELEENLLDFYGVEKSVEDCCVDYKWFVSPNVL